MGQYNLIQYNLDPYNLDGEQREIYGVISIAETVSSLGRGSFRVFLPKAIAETVNGSAIGSAGRFSAAEMNETVSAESELIGLYSRPVSVTEVIDSDSSVIAIIHADLEIPENIQADVRISGYIFQQASLDEVILGDTVISSSTFRGVSVNELINAVASTYVFEKQTCTLDLTVRPGQTLVIDAENYIVLLDGQTMIKAHSGAWIDELDRATEAISINAESGIVGLKASILYRNRYL